MSFVLRLTTCVLDPVNKSISVSLPLQTLFSFCLCRKRPVDKDYHGFDGPLPVSSDFDLTEANQAFLDAGM